MYLFNDTIPMALNNLTVASAPLDNSTINTTLSHQKSLEDIILKESARLKTKEHSIELATTSQNRLITLNENFNKQYAEYMKLSVAAACALAIIGIAYYLKLNDTILSIITVITLSILLMFVVFVFSSINNRDAIYFDEIKYVSPLGSGSENNTTATTTTNVSGQINASSYCFGSDCCSQGTIWDSDLTKCVKVISAFTTLDEAYKTTKKGCNIFPVKNPVISPKVDPAESAVTQAFEKSEFDSYAKI